MSFRERRRSSPLPVSSQIAAEQSNVDFYNATEAMQRAADAMIAATESFRQQFRQQDINAVPFNHAQGGTGSQSGSSSGSGSGSRNNSLTTPRAPSAASQHTANTRRRPVSYQPYRPQTADAASQDRITPLLPIVRPISAVLARNSFSSPAIAGTAPHAYTPLSGHTSVSPIAPVFPPTAAGSAYTSPYSMYRATRASMSSPALPASQYNAMAAAASTAAAGPVSPLSSHTPSQMPTVEPYPVDPNPENSLHQPFTSNAPLDNPGIATDRWMSSMPPAYPVIDAGSSGDQVSQLAKTAGPLGMHPLNVNPQQPSRVPQQMAQNDQQAGQEPSQQSQYPLAQEEQNTEATADDAGPAASRTSWSLMPRISTPSRPSSHQPALPTLSPSSEQIDGAMRQPQAAGRQPSTASYVDLIEAASRLKHTCSYHDIDRTCQMSPRGTTSLPKSQDSKIGGEAEIEADVEPEPILQIGRYTYVRSEAGEHDHRASLIRDDGSRRFTAFSVSAAGSKRGPGGNPSGLGYRRKGQIRTPSKSKIQSNNGPYGFSLAHESLFVLIICLSQMLMLAGIAQALIPARIMSLSFPDANPGTIAWYTASYGLTSGTFVLPAGRLGDLFGHRRVFVAGFVWFAIWSLLAGFTPMIQLATRNPGTSHVGTTLFIVCRAMQGIGPAMLVPNGQAMLGRAYPPGPRKNVVMSLFGAASPFGFVLGAVMSALFAVYASWPWAFWTLAAVCVALAAVSLLVLPAGEPREPVFRPTDMARIEEDADDAAVTKLPPKRESLWVRMDGMGIVLGVAGLVLVNFAFNQAPIVGWSTPYTYFLLILGLLFVAAFLYVEAFQAAHPLVPLAAMRSTTNFVLACTATGWGCFSVWIYYAIQMLENLRGWSPLMTSAAFAPAPITGLIASVSTGYLFSRGVKPHWVMLISMFAFFIGSLLFATSAPDQLYWLNPFFSILIMPFGMDMSNPAAIILVSNSVRREHQGIAASLVVTFVNYAISLALGISGSVEAGVFDANDLLVGYRAAQYFGLGLGGLGVVFGTAFLCQNYLRTPPAPLTEKVSSRREEP
ncbi:hypothetical protein SEPCBS119000_003878 [Sporothrix epigloea]|uniref:Major facilitator superfamily (MFS) profile domain-containing protein n=1 Tax=Sporothrix epigloea TaxID=1892477 RepID=A0ABP0DP33_9PEZI